MIRLRSPAFWWQAPPEAWNAVAADALAPLGNVYGTLAARRMRRPGFRAPVPVLCVGNLVVGGAGKTPMALALARHLIAAGESPWFLSRGYGSAAERGPPVLVDAAAHRAEQVGDEALLLAGIAPTLASGDRVSSARAAAERGASLLILDDGLQNPALEKDLRLIVVDAGAGIGNGLCLPAGPLRAPLSAQLDFACALAIVGDGSQGASLAAMAERAGKPALHARLAVSAEKAKDFAGRRVYAFAGIARPTKFFATLEELGAKIVGKVGFPDHYAYRRRDIAQLQRAAKDADAQLVTTEKDLVRVKPWDEFVEAALPQPMALTVEMILSDAAAFGGVVAQALTLARGKIISSA